MPGEIITKKTRHEFREFFVGWSLRQIEAEFDVADVRCDTDYVPPTSGARRSLVEQYYHSVDWSKWEDVRKVVVVFQNVLTYLEQLFGPDAGINGDYPRKAFTALKKWIARDGFRYEDGKLIPIGKTAQLSEVRAVAANFDAPELHRQIDRMQGAVNDDPGLAIGTAKELIETTCKTILSERGKLVDDNWDIGDLMKETRKLLGLLPDNVPNAAKGADTIKRLLSNLATIAQGLGELRNLYGTGHGKHGSTKGLSQRHARLAVGAASTLATFLFETHQERSK